MKDHSDSLSTSEERNPRQASSLIWLVAIAFFSLVGAGQPTFAQAGYPASCTDTPASGTYKCREIRVGSEWTYLASVAVPPYNLGPFRSISEAVNASAAVYLPVGGTACSATPTGVVMDFVAPLSNYGVVYRRQHRAHFDVVFSNSTLPACTTTYDYVADIDQRRTVDCRHDGEVDGDWTAYTDPSTGHTFCRAAWSTPTKRPCNDCKSNPVDIAGGTKIQREALYRRSGTSALDFSIEYDARFARVNGAHLSNDNKEPRNPIGIGWFSLYFQSIREFDEGAGFREVDARRASNRSVFFRDVSGVMVADADDKERLVRIVDGLGNTAGWELTTANDALETYDADGRLVELRDRSGVVQTLSYSGASREPTSVTDSFGKALTFAYETTSTNRLLTVTLPDSGVITFGYGSSNRLTTVTLPDSTVRTFHYEDSNYGNGNLLTGVTDESSVRFSTFAYDSDGRAVSSTHAGSAGSHSFTYGWSSNTVTDPLSTTRTYATSIIWGGRRISGSNTPCPGCGDDKARTFDANGNVLSRKDFNDQLACYDYNTSRNLETVRVEGFASSVTSCPGSLSSYTPAGGTRERKVTTAWHSTYRLPTSITESDRTTTFTHDADGNILTRTVTDTTVSPTVSRTWTYTYNGFGQVLTEDGPRTDVSDVTTYTYYTCTSGYQCGQLNTVQNALGHTTTYNSYNAHGQPTQITDANGLVTSIAYDARQRVTDRCSGGSLPSCTGGELTHLDYWPTGLLKKVTNPDASYIQYSYDNAHRLTQIQDGSANKIVYTLDNMGNRTAEDTYDPSNALRRTHSRVYNTLNQLWKDVNAAGTSAVTTTFGYDSNGNQTSTAAPLSRSSSSLYDELNRLSQITDPASGVTQFGYDAQDNLTSVTDPRSLVTSYDYNGFGDLITQTSPDTGVTSNTYDSGGNLDTSTDSRSSVSDYAYDAANRVTSVSFTVGGTTDQTINYGYDAGTNQKGKLTSAWDANHSLAWTYDTHGRVTGKGQTVGSTTLGIGYGYDSAGRLGSITLPSGSVIAYGYNSNGQVTSATLNGGTTILSGVTYDPFGPVTGWTWGNSTTASRDFDTDGKVTQIDNANGTSLKTYGYDDAFRITGITDVGNSALSWTYGYDSLDRLNSAVSSSVTQGWTYDANGNRLSQTGTTASTYTNSLTSNRLSTTTGTLARTYAYDNAGNTLSYSGATFTYNNRGRMLTASNGGTTATYTYNALGQRVKRATSSLTTLYVYDEAGHLAGEYDNTGALIQETVWLGDTPIATLRPNGSGGVILYYVHADHLNTPRLITDTSNNLRWSWESDAFGTSVPNANPASLGTFEYNLRFPGQQHDTVVGFNYNYFRDYDPQVGRYVESDPIGIGDGPNTYSYTAANPNSFSDPTGEFVPGAIYAAESIYSAYRAWAAAAAAVTIAAGSSAAHEYGKQKSYLEINRDCLKQPKNPGDYCAWLSNQITHFENCAKWYQWWDNKYAIGRHKEKIDGWRNRAENLKKLYDKLCTQKCSTMTEDSK